MDKDKIQRLQASVFGTASELTADNSLGFDDSIGRNRVDKDPFDDFYTSNNFNGMILRPVARPDRMYELYEDSDVWQACVKALQMNVDGFGYRTHYLGDDVNKADKIVAKEEQALKDFCDHPNDDMSLREIRKQVREDLEVIGQGAMEGVRYPRSGRLAMLHHMPLVDSRICTFHDDDFVKVKITIPRDGELKKMVVRKRFRRYCQISPGERVLKWFKAWGDPRIMDSSNGQFVNSKRECKAEPATELLWIKNPFGGRTYGVPRIFGALKSVASRSQAQFVNYDLFENQGIPPVLIMVENGTLTDESKVEIRKLFQRMRGVKNFNRVGIIEAVGDMLGLDESSAVKISIKSMNDHRKVDEMFTKHLGTTYEDVTQVYRIPSLYLGGVSAYSYASAFTSQSVAEEQIFVPEREAFDELFNHVIVQGELGIRAWTYASKGPKTVGAEQFRLALKEFGDAGAISIDNAIELANDMFGLQMSKYNTEWSRLPATLLKLGINSGQIILPEMNAFVNDVIHPSIAA